jgi:hypothetical protein
MNRTRAGMSALITAALLATPWVASGAAAHPPHHDDCVVSDLPAGSLVIDDAPHQANRPCAAGSFTLAARDAVRRGSSGYHGGAWTATVRSDTDLAVMGTWRFRRAQHGWGRVLVHVPATGASSQSASYSIGGLARHGQGDPHAVRRVGQALREDAWVDLGSFRFAGRPVVRLTNLQSPSTLGTPLAAVGRDTVAFDAVAFVPLPGKPRHSVVVLGDSYSSGEGAGDYLPGTDQDGATAGDPATNTRNACHRSRNAWARLATLPDRPDAPLGVRADSLDPSLDFHFLACSGARTYSVLPASAPPTAGGANPAANHGQYGETTQLDMGFLDRNTTLVALTIGGNDARWGEIVRTCISAAVCQETTLPGDDAPLVVAEPARIAGPVTDAVVLTLREIARRAPRAQIVLVGYPPLVESTVLAQPQCAPYAAALNLQPSETAWVEATTAQMNAALAVAARRVSADTGSTVSFRDPTAAFAGRSICGSGGLPSAFNAVVQTPTPGDTGVPSAESFHPNLIGTRLYAELVW